MAPVDDPGSSPGEDATAEDDTDRQMAEWVALVPEIDPVVEGVVDRLLLSSRYLEQLAAECAAPHGMSGTDYEIVARLFWVGPPHRLAPSQLAAGTRAPTTTITNRLDRMTRQGLVTRVPHPTDRRSQLAELTTAGRATFELVIAEQARRERELVAGIDRADLRQLGDLLRQLMSEMRQKLGPVPRRVALAALGTSAPSPAGEETGRPATAAAD